MSKINKPSFTKILLFCFLGVFFSLLVINSLPGSMFTKTYAQAPPASGEWINGSRIKYNGWIFLRGDAFYNGDNNDLSRDPNSLKIFINASESCDDKYSVIVLSDDSGSKASVFLNTNNRGSCASSPQTEISLSKSENKTLYGLFADKSSASIVSVPPGCEYIAEDYYNDGAYQVIYEYIDTVVGDMPTTATQAFNSGKSLYVAVQGNGDFDTGDILQINSSGKIEWIWSDGYDKGSSTSCLVQLKTTTADDPGLKPGGGGDTPPGGGTATDITDCELTVNPLTWLICPIVDGLQIVIRALDNAITNLLFIQTEDEKVNGKVIESQYDNRDTAVAQAWSSFRYISLGILVIIALIIIISQAISVGPFDAYTIKKAFPRLVAAVILIVLSWDLCVLLINISNEFGVGIRGIILAPFKSSLGDLELSSGTMGLALAGTAGIGLVLGLIGILTFLLTGVMAVLVAFVTLVFREMLIMFLVIMAPVAIVCSILPNTQVVWKRWWDFLFKALVMFPIIIGMISIGQAFARVAVAQDPGFMGQVIAFIAWIGPYFMIPKTFQWAGGAIGAVGGGLGKLKGGVDARLGKFRQNQVARNVGKMRTGSRFENEGRIRSRFNKISAGGATGLSGRFGLGQRGNQAVAQNMAAAAAAARERNPRLNSIDPDTATALGLSGGSERRARQQLQGLGWNEDRVNSAIAGGHAAGGYNAETARAGLDSLIKMKAPTIPQGDIGRIRDAAEAVGMSGADAEATFSSFQRAAKENARGVDLGADSVRTGMMQANMKDLATSTDESFGTGLAQLYTDSQSHPDENQRFVATQRLHEIVNSPSMNDGSKRGIIEGMKDQIHSAPPTTPGGPRTPIARSARVSDAEQLSINSGGAISPEDIASSSARGLNVVDDGTQ